MGNEENKSNRDVMESKLGGALASIVWLGARALSFVVFTVFGGLIHYGAKCLSRRNQDGE